MNIKYISQVNIPHKTLQFADDPKANFAGPSSSFPSLACLFLPFTFISFITSTEKLLRRISSTNGFGRFEATIINLDFQGDKNINAVK